jgi:hypothetical protein
MDGLPGAESNVPVMPVDMLNNGPAPYLDGVLLVRRGAAQQQGFRARLSGQEGF